MSSGSPCDRQSSKGVPTTTLGFKGCSNPKNSAQGSFHLLLIEIPRSAFSADIKSWERGTDEPTETLWRRKAQRQRAIHKCSHEHGTASVQQLQQDWNQRTTPISRLQKQKRRNLRESSQQLSSRRSFSLLPEQKKQHFESSKHVEDYEDHRERQTQRERERGKKKAYQEEKDSFLRRMIITGRSLMLPSSLPGSRHSSCSPQSAISVSLANNNNTHTKHS
jgi:hypothetical protein